MKFFKFLNKKPIERPFNSEPIGIDEFIKNELKILESSNADVLSNKSFLNILDSFTSLQSRYTYNSFLKCMSQLVSSIESDNYSNAAKYEISKIIVKLYDNLDNVSSRFSRSGDLGELTTFFDRDNSLGERESIENYCKALITMNRLSTEYYIHEIGTPDATAVDMNNLSETIIPQATDLTNEEVLEAVAANENLDYEELNANIDEDTLPKPSLTISGANEPDNILRFINEIINYNSYGSEDITQSSAILDFFNQKDENKKIVTDLICKELNIDKYIADEDKSRTPKP